MLISWKQVLVPAIGLSLSLSQWGTAQSPGQTLLGVQGLPGSQGDFAGATEASVGFGVFFGRWDEPEPDKYNWANNVDDINDLGEYLKGLKQNGIASYVMIANVHMESLEMPEYLDGKPFDDPYVLERWELYLKRLLERYGRWIDYISIGNEVDWYFSQHEQQFPSFVTFLARGAEVIRREAPHIAVGAALQSGGLDRWWPALEPHLDYLGATYYAPVNMFGITGNHPLDEENSQYFTKALDRVLQAAGDKKVILTELGCATAPETNSSPEAQAEFIRRFFQWLAKHDEQILALQYIGLQDWPYEGTKIVLQPLLSAELLADETFMRYLTSLGLHDEKGVAKPGWRAWLEAARAYRENEAALGLAVGALASNAEGGLQAEGTTRASGRTLITFDPYKAIAAE